MSRPDASDVTRARSALGEGGRHGGANGLCRSLMPPGVKRRLKACEAIRGVQTNEPLVEFGHYCGAAQP